MKNKLFLSVVIPVYNERSINKVVKQVLSSVDRYDSEIIVVDTISRSTIKRISDKVRGKVRMVVAKKGRANQMNKGAAVARGRVLLFLHADSRLPFKTDVLILKTIEKGFVGGAFSLQLDSTSWFLAFVSWFTTLRSFISKVPYGDQGIFIRKDFFDSLHGFKNFPILEEVDFMERVRKNKGKIKILKEKMISSARRWDQSGLLSTSVKNRVIMVLHYVRVDPKIILSLIKR